MASQFRSDLRQGFWLAHLGLDALGSLRGHRLDDLDEQRRLVGELVVDGLLRHAGMDCDFIHTGAVEATGQE